MVHVTGRPSCRPPVPPSPGRALQEARNAGSTQARVNGSKSTRCSFRITQEESPARAQPPGYRWAAGTACADKDFTPVPPASVTM